MNDRLFDLTLSEAEDLVGLKRTTFRNNVVSKLTQGYHYWVEKPGRYSIKFFSKVRLLEWQQIGHDPKKMQAAIETWQKSLEPKHETSKSRTDSGTGISA